MKSKHAAPELELSRPLAVEKISANGMVETVRADASERQKLADRFGLLDIASLQAELNIQTERADRLVVVTGTIIADVTQQCVVTLEPLPAHIEREVKVLYAPLEEVEVEGSGPADPEGEDMEPIIDGVIDLGELVAQNLGIALDPYPRKPGIAPVEAEYGSRDSVPGPLAQLAQLVKKPKDSG